MPLYCFLFQPTDYLLIHKVHTTTQVIWIFTIYNSEQIIFSLCIAIYMQISSTSGNLKIGIQF